jgi:hypothetical protein
MNVVCYCPFNIWTCVMCLLANYFQCLRTTAEIIKIISSSSIQKLLLILRYLQLFYIKTLLILRYLQLFYLKTVADTQVSTSVFQLEPLLILVLDIQEIILEKLNILSTSHHYKKYDLWHFVTKYLLWCSGDENNNIIEGVSLNTFCDILIKKCHKW